MPNVTITEETARAAFFIGCRIAYERGDAGDIFPTAENVLRLCTPSFITGTLYPLIIGREVRS